MRYSKDYYRILNLQRYAPSPSWCAPRSHGQNQNQDDNQEQAQHLTTAVLRRAYKVALLATHPDKQQAGPIETPKRSREPDVKHGAARADSMVTVDDVKEAYAVLVEAGTRAEYNDWVVRGGCRGGGGGAAAAAAEEEQGVSADFILGLEALDLSDFEAVVSDGGAGVRGRDGDADAIADSEGKGQRTTWTKGCRCGAQRAFEIKEEQLEVAEQRGDSEVLVGCEGCSLWVRVGFGVEEC